MFSNVFLYLRFICGKMYTNLYSVGLKNGNKVERYYTPYRAQKWRNPGVLDWPLDGHFGQTSGFDERWSLIAKPGFYGSYESVTSLVTLYLLQYYY